MRKLLIGAAVLGLFPFWNWFKKEEPARVPESPLVLDISQWQDPANIDYDRLAPNVDLVIVRVQRGGYTEDQFYRTHIEEFQARGVPVNVYAFCLADNEQSAIGEAQVFYVRTKDYDLATYWVDIEWDVTDDARSTIEAYRVELKRLLGDQTKVGVYMGDDLVDGYNIDMNKFDGIWLAKYDYNDEGTTFPYFTGLSPIHMCDLHQYTENGRLPGYGDYLDFSRLTLARGKTLEYFGYK